MKRRLIPRRLAANCAHSSAKWLRFYLDFCSKYGHSRDLKSSFPLFMAKLASKNQPEAKRSEASVAVTLYFRMAITGKANALSKSKTESDRACKGAEPAGASPVTAIREAEADHPAREDRPLTNSPDGFTADLRIREPGEPMPLRRDRIPVAAPIKARGSSWLTQYEEMKGAVRTRNYRGLPPIGSGSSKPLRSEPPDHLNTEDVKGFLTDLTARQNVASATQKSGIQRPSLLLPACFAPRVWVRSSCEIHRAPCLLEGYTRHRLQIV